MLQTDQNQGMTDRDLKVEERITVQEGVGELIIVFYKMES